MTQKQGLFARKGITLSPKVYFVDAMGALALGLFASLLIGTIMDTMAVQIFDRLGGSVFTSLSDLFRSIALVTRIVQGAIMGSAVAYALKAPPLVLFGAGVVGFMASFPAAVAAPTAFNNVFVDGGPATVFIAVIIAVEVSKLVSKSTKVDIIVTPFTTLFTGALVAVFLGPWIADLMRVLGNFVNNAANMQPFFAGIIIAVVMGMILTLPLSSAALCAMIGISGIAGGAALAGGAANMIGFAVISYRENKAGGLVAQGLGTSMLQMGNIVRKPIIWLPVIIASAITGPLSTMVFGLQVDGIAAGMGTCGLVGPIGVVTTHIASETANPDAMMWIGIVLVMFVLPAAISLGISEIMRKSGWIKDGDMKLDL